MLPGFKKNLYLSITLHVVGIVVLALVLAFSPKPDKVEWIEISSLPLDHPAPGPSDSIPQPVPPDTGSPSPPLDNPVPPVPKPEPPQPPEPPAPAPEPQPKEPEPPPQAPPEPAPAPAPKKIEKTPSPTSPMPPKHVVKVNTTKIVKRITLPDTGSANAKPVKKGTSSSFDSSQFAQNLLNKIGSSRNFVSGPSNGSSSASGISNEVAAYYNLIFQKMYSSWQPPFGADEGMATPVILRVEKNGTISKVSLASSSGNNEMDNSALAAANRIKTLPPLPSGLGTDHADITVDFKIQH